MSKSSQTVDNDQYVRALATMLTRHADSSETYKAGIDVADQEIRPIFVELMTLHASFRDQLSDLLKCNGQTPDADGSWVALVNQGLITVRGFLDQLDERFVPKLIEAEERILAANQDLRGDPACADYDFRILDRQHGLLQIQVDKLKNFPLSSF